MNYEEIQKLKERQIKRIKDYDNRKHNRLIDKFAILSIVSLGLVIIGYNANKIDSKFNRDLTFTFSEEDEKIIKNLPKDSNELSQRLYSLDEPELFYNNEQDLVDEIHPDTGKYWDGYNEFDDFRQYKFQSVNI